MNFIPHRRHFIRPQCWLWFAALLLWIAVLAQPWPRNLLRAACDHTRVTEAALNVLHPSRFWDSDPSTLGLSFLDQNRRDQLLARLPNDRDVRLSHCLLPSQQWDSLEVQRLLHDYPDDPVILSFYLRRYSELYHQTRPRGNLTPNLPESSLERIVPWTANELRMWSSLEKTVRHGHELEPGNLWYNWNLIHILFELGRDEEALKLLLQVPRKSYYQDHLEKVCLADVRARSIRDRITPIDCQTWSFFTGRYPQLERLGRWIMEHAHASAQRGDHARAINIGMALLRWGRRIRLNSSQRSEFNDGGRLEREALFAWKPDYIAWNWPGRRPLVSSSENLAGFAFAHGHLAASQEASAEWAKLLAWDRARWYGVDSLPNSGAASFQLALNRCFSIFLVSLVAILPLWLTAFAIRFCARKKGRPEGLNPAVAHLAAANGILGIVLLLAFEVSIPWRQSAHGGGNFVFSSDGATPIWQVLGPVCCAIFFVVVAGSTHWLRTQSDWPASWADRTLRLAAGTDRLAGHSVKFFALVPRLSLWILSLAGLAVALFYPQRGPFFEEDLSWPVLYLFPVLTLWQFCLWRRIKGKRMSTRIAFLFVDAVRTYLLLGLLLFPLAFLALSPAAAAYQQTYQAQVARGTLFAARAVLGF